MNGKRPPKGAPAPGLPATSTVRDPSLELEALVRLAGARDLLDHVLLGDVVPQPWTSAARDLVAQAERFFEVVGVLS